MKEDKPESHSGICLDARAVDAIEKALKMPFGPERTAALQEVRASLRNVSAKYGWLFSDELKPPE